MQFKLEVLQGIGVRLTSVSRGPEMEVSLHFFKVVLRCNLLEFDEVLEGRFLAGMGGICVVGGTSGSTALGWVDEGLR